MTDLEPVTTAASPGYSTALGPSEEPASPLTVPWVAGDAPLDALSALLLGIEQQNQVTLQVNLQEIASARERLVDLQRQLAEQLKRAIEAAEHDKHDKHGWFSRNFGSVFDTVAKVFAKHVEILKDVVVLPADVLVSIGKSFNDREALLQSLRQDLGKLSESSETERAVAGFVSGTARFTSDLLAFELMVVTALAANAARGDSLGDAVRDQASQLYASLQANILENPDFWVVTERLAQAAAIAGAFASGGLAGPIALALVLALEADKRYGYVADIAGKEAAPWVRMGLQVGAAVCLGVGSGTGGWLDAIKLATGIVQGAGSVYQGVRTWQESRREAEALDRQTDMRETLQHIQEMQRLIERLIELYEDKDQARARMVDSSIALVETQASTEASLVLQA